MLQLAAILVTFFGGACGRIFTACDFAAELSKPQHRVDFWQIPTWVCLAHHASGLDTSYKHSEYYFGIFRIAEHWCSRCGFNCSDLADDDVSKDIDCAVNVVFKEHGGTQDNGFYGAWGDWYTDFCTDPWMTLDKFDCNVEPVSLHINDQLNIVNNHSLSSSTLNPPTNQGFLHSNSSYFWSDLSITLACGAYVGVIILVVYLYRSNLYERLLKF